MCPKNVRFVLPLICAAAMLSSAPVLGKLSMPKFSLPKSVRMPSMTDVSAFFGSYVYEAESAEKEYPFPAPGVLTINNIEGNITVQEWQQDAVRLKVVKRSNVHNNLENLSIQENSAHKDGQSHLSLTSTYHGEKTKGAIDYFVQVPSRTSLKVRTGKGAVTIHDVQGKIMAQTGEGPISVNGTKGTLLAQTEKTGDITTDNAAGDIKAITRKGNIYVRNASNSVIASAERGKIETSFEKLPETGRVELHAAHGNVSVALPSTANAHIQGSTKHGVLTSTHYIALRPHTTQLNKDAWKQFKKEVEGTIGTGEAEIKLTSTSGNISILDTSAA